MTNEEYRIWLDNISETEFSQLLTLEIEYDKIRTREEKDKVKILFQLATPPTLIYSTISFLFLGKRATKKREK